MGSTDEQFCLRWNDFQQCIKSTFQDLRDDKDFLDVTVSCDGEQVKAHKVILSACSVTFRNLLKKNPAQHPVIVLWDVNPNDLAAIMDFMYHGEVNVKQENLNSFLAVAERLRVRGLCQGDTGSASDSRDVARGISNGGSAKPKTSRPSEASESSAKRARISPPPPPAAPEEEDDIEELPPPVAVKQERTEDNTVAISSPAARSAPRPPSQSYGGAPVQPDYRIAEQGAQYDENSEYGDYSGYEEDMSYMSEPGTPGMMGMAGVDPGTGKDYINTYCEECHKNFTATSTYRRHMRDYHTVEQMHPCDLCDKVFKNRGLLINHKSQKHRDSKTSGYHVF